MIFFKFSFSKFLKIYKIWAIIKFENDFVKINKLDRYLKRGFIEPLQLYHFFKILFLASYRIRKCIDKMNLHTNGFFKAETSHSNTTMNFFRLFQVFYTNNKISLGIEFLWCYIQEILKTANMRVKLSQLILMHKSPIFF